MSFVESGDDQSEDGELRHSPSDARQKGEALDFSLSDDDEDGEAADSLDIKPPQARVVPVSNRTKRRDGYDGKSRHKRSERHREERVYSHREKHHREKQLRPAKERELYHRDKERYYREQIGFKETYTEVQYINERVYREHKEEVPRSSRHVESRKKDREVRDIREVRYLEKHRKEKYPDEKWEKSAGDKALEDLRERLLSKRSTGKGDDETVKVDRKEGHRDRKNKDNETLDSVLQGEAGMYVKEIINISTGEEKRKKQDKPKDDEKLTEEEKAEQELRREKLLEAEREMARLKEQSRIERERRHLEKQAKRKLEEEEEHFSKRLQVDDNNVVTVSDNSDTELNNDVDDDDDKSYHSDHSVIESSNESVHSVEQSERKSRSRSRTSSREITPESDERSRSRSRSIERSKSKSPKSFNKLPAVQKMKFTEYPVSNLRSRFSMLTEQGQAMLQKFLTFDPVQRTTADDALQHPYFTETPLPIDPSMFPTWPAKSELGHRRALAASPKPPSGGGEYKQLGGDGDEDGLGFRIGMNVSENRRMGGGFSLKF
ncbi:hypothetical protein PPYR_11836 [Photinus pyralis]|uniref:Protein kinase domain-containing protein n=1 Tax=Photinus pyralis TaxID=7054 RepID=A0A5N4ACD7_PHOPY|nr:hypothetical protein PPYR_11836 [Photinus pyralis]